MMRAPTVDILKRLSKGKNALSESELIAFCREVGSASDAEIIDAVAKKVRRATAPKPAWLVEMERERKRIKWSATEAVDKLVEIAATEGLVSRDIFGSRKTPSFPSAAKAIAKKSDGERLVAAYKREIDRLVAQNQVG